MKIKKLSLKILLIFLLLFVFTFNNQNKVNVSALDNSAEIVMELNSGRILHQKNAYDKKYMASTTKILTAICVIENCDLDEIVTVSKNTIGIEGSSIYLEEGEKLSVKHLLYGLMLRSGNDCAETLAVHCSGSIEMFAQLMNKTAKNAGAISSNFVNPHGLHDDNHYTTAYDLAQISRYAMNNEEFKEIVSTKSIKIPFTTQNYDRLLINKNKMLYNFDGSNGIKTGYTKKAGRCLVSACERNGIKFICVVLNCPPMFERSMTLLDNAYSNYKNYKLVESDNIIDFINIDNTDKTCAIGINNDIILPLTNDEKNDIKIVYDYPKSISKPLKKQTEIGLVKIYCKNLLIFEQKIYTIVDVK